MLRTDLGISPTPGSSVKKDTFPDSVNAEVFDKLVEFGIYIGVNEIAEKELGVDIHVGGVILLLLPNR